MVLGSAASFGTLPILVKLAYATGLTPFQTLAFRFLFAAAGLHLLAWLRGEHVFSVGARRLIQFLLLGVVGYAAQSAAFFGALCCLPASLVELIAYIYPSLVALGMLTASTVGAYLGIASSGIDSDCGDIANATRLKLGQFVYVYAVLRALRITKSRRSEYDHLMLGLHDSAKADLEEAKLAGLRPSRPKAGVAVAGDDDDEDDDDLDLGPEAAGEDGTGRRGRDGSVLDRAVTIIRVVTLCPARPRSSSSP